MVVWDELVLIGNGTKVLLLLLRTALTEVGVQKQGDYTLSTHCSHSTASAAPKAGMRFRGRPGTVDSEGVETTLRTTPA